MSLTDNVSSTCDVIFLSLPSNLIRKDLVFILSKKHMLKKNQRASVMLYRDLALCLVLSFQPVKI